MARCIYCGCRDEVACEGGCSWLLYLGDTKGVCSQCGARGRVSEFSFRRMLNQAWRAVDSKGGGKKKSALVHVKAKDLLALLAARAFAEDMETSRSQQEYAEDLAERFDGAHTKAHRKAGVKA